MGIDSILLRLRVLLFCRLRGTRVFLVDKCQVQLALPASSNPRLVLYSPARPLSNCGRIVGGLWIALGLKILELFMVDKCQVLLALMLRRFSLFYILRQVSYFNCGRIL